MVRTNLSQKTFAIGWTLQGLPPATSPNFMSPSFQSGLSVVLAFNGKTTPQHIWKLRPFLQHILNNSRPPSVWNVMKAVRCLFAHNVVPFFNILEIFDKESTSVAKMDSVQAVMVVASFIHICKLVVLGRSIYRTVTEFSRPGIFLQF